jgi:Alpha/beta hydrolase domain
MRSFFGSRFATHARTAALPVLLIAVSGISGKSGHHRLAAQAGVPNPTVIGPIEAPATPGDPSHNYPFFSPSIDLASRGYVEEEFFFAGLASRYDIPAAITIANTPMYTATVIESGVPYQTRMIVRRPASAALFNGTVLMEWQNVTFGHDVDAVWLISAEHLMRRGYAWIGVSTQRVGVHGFPPPQPNRGLKTWNPSRYGSLDLTFGGVLQDDSLQYDVFSQAAQAVRSPFGNDPMGGLPVDRVIALGLSQGAIRMVAYHNAVHPHSRIFDGFMLLLHGGLVRDYLSDELIADLAVPVYKLLSETDVWRDQVAYRQPDSSMLRAWEVAGAAHLDFHVASSLFPLQMRDLAYVPTTTCQAPPLSRIPVTFVFNAALDHLADWVKHGVSPPAAPRIVTDVTTNAIVRDGDGNALGGIRLSQHAVPTATNTGVNGPQTNACRTYGSYVPFDATTLEELYPSHQLYLTRVIEATQESQSQGFIVGVDAAATISDAARSDVGRR